MFVLAALVTACSQAADLHHLPGRVVRIVDGDTIVLDVAGAQHRVRLAGIDALEKNQPWGEAPARANCAARLPGNMSSLAGTSAIVGSG